MVVLLLIDLIEMRRVKAGQRQPGSVYESKQTVPLEVATLPLEECCCELPFPTPVFWDAL